MNEYYLLKDNLSIELYKKTQGNPIVDYHSHISAKTIANNSSFSSITELWLKDDHYKWRAMRLNGMSEDVCTGNASDFDKFKAWSSTSSKIFRNPLYHWNKIELFKYFNITKELNNETCDEIWGLTNEMLLEPNFRPMELLKRNKVEILCTTDDPVDSLEYHYKIREFKNFDTNVYPTFRPDAACALNGTKKFNEWLSKLRVISNIDINNLESFLEALKKRHDDFDAAGCRISDHGLNYIDFTICSDIQANTIFTKLLSGEDLDKGQINLWKNFLMIKFGHWNYEKKWVMMLHIGALRNNNDRVNSSIGFDSGCDSIGDYSHAEGINKFLNELNNQNKLYKIILFNSNPKDSFQFATIPGNFFEEEMKGKIQYGPAWWFLDSINGIKEQFDFYSTTGIAENYVGMVTDSRSFLSFSRHDFFRKIICNIYADDITEGFLSVSNDTIINSLNKIFSINAFEYFNWESK